MLLAWYAAVRHDLMAAREGRSGHGPAASGPVLDDVRSGAGMGGAALQVSLPDIPWSAPFGLGAIVSPPDVAAATAILSRVNIPRNVVTVLEGESLVNDASGLVIYKFAVAAVLTGAFSLLEASVQFVGVAVGGVVIGVVMGRLFVFIHRYLGDAFIEVLTTLAVPYVTYIIAESLDVAGVHASGVLAVVAAGVVRGRYSPEIVSAEMRIIARSEIGRAHV